MTRGMAGDPKGPVLLSLPAQCHQPCSGCPGTSPLTFSTPGLPSPNTSTTHTPLFYFCTAEHHEASGSTTNKASNPEWALWCLCRNPFIKSSPSFLLHKDDSKHFLLLSHIQRCGYLPCSQHFSHSYHLQLITLLTDM